MIQATAGAPMQILGKPGWFTRPAKGKAPKKDTPFGYFFDPENNLTIPTIEAEAKCEGVVGRGQSAEEEFLQWTWINDWDKELKNGVTLEESLEKYPLVVKKLKYAGRKKPKGTKA